jgi:hypothetical protein
MRIPRDICKSYADSLAGVGAAEANAIMAEWEYVASLYEQDWDYSAKQDAEQWARGLASMQRIINMRLQLDPDLKLWNAHVPQAFRVGEQTLDRV